MMAPTKYIYIWLRVILYGRPLMMRLGHRESPIVVFGHDLHDFGRLTQG